jgi:hypothetical protein
MSSLRVFVSDTADAEWSELTEGVQPTVRLRARDLQHAQRASRRIHDTAAVAVVLDVRVVIAEDHRTAYRRLAELDGSTGSVQYAGTVDGLAGLVDDIVAAGVADGVNLIPAGTQSDLRSVAEQTVERLRLRSRRRPGVPGSRASA